MADLVGSEPRVPAQNLTCEQVQAFNGQGFYPQLYSAQHIHSCAACQGWMVHWRNRPTIARQVIAFLFRR